jgi:hypothetical protein
MNPKYLGDAKDLFKRGFLNLVRSFSVVRGPKILPLFTGEFKPPDVAAYLKLLEIAESNIVSQARFYPCQGRREHIDATLIKKHARNDLFLDPDRGLVANLRGNTTDREVITFEEIAALLPTHTDRVLMIYDESVSMAGRKKATSKKLDMLQAKPWRLSAFTYFNVSPNHPNVLFVANKSGQSRLTKIRNELLHAGIPSTKLLPVQ